MNQAQRFQKATDPKSKSLAGLVREFFEILDTLETSVAGNEFHPTQIISCRVMHTAKLSKLLPLMKQLASKKRNKHETD